MRCETCRRRIARSHENCPHCGARVTSLTTGGATDLIVAERKSPPAAALMSFFLPGLGQLYVGQTGKGVLFFVLLVLGFFTGGASHLALLLYATAEAWVLAKRLRGGQPISRWGTIWDPTWEPFWS
ncbi:MAG: TM2 domain-containing protein [Candidatus Sericytochromatia bacterium]|nr:TM2 domain-containing protein [Candidatus Tanganyikabacteria bacterium]